MLHFKRPARVVLATVITILLLISPASAVQAENERLDPPMWGTSIVAKMQYENDPIILTPPVPESEMSHIKFSEKWIFENDLNSHPKAVKVAFPTSWVNNTERQQISGMSVDLSIPTQMLKDANKSQDPEEILVTFTYIFFKGLPTLPTKSLDNNFESSDSSDVDVKGGLRFTPDYYKVIGYNNQGDEILGAEGIVYPTDNYNESNDFNSYHEIQYSDIYGKYGDGVEIICEIQDDGDIYVWYAVMDDGDQEVVSRNWLIVQVDIEDEIEYYFYLSGSTLRAYLYDTSWHSNTVTVSPTDDYYWVNGSNEFEVNSISDDFYLRTAPISCEFLYVDGNWEDQYYVNENLDYYGESPDNDYVDVYSYLDEYDGLRFNQVTQS